MTVTTKGFTAIELLITLFVAAFALATGYQLYAAVINADRATRMEAEVGAKAQREIRRYSNSATAPCTSSALAYQPKVDLGGTLGEGRMTVIRDCPNLALPNLNRIRVTIEYDTPVKAVTHAMYITPGGL